MKKIWKEIENINKMITKKKINKEITFFYYEEINSKTIDELIEFIENNPKSNNSKYRDGTDILISYVQIEFNSNKPSSIKIGVNMRGVVDYEIKPKNYYYFKDGTIEWVENPDDVVIWD